MTLQLSSTERNLWFIALLVSIGLCLFYGLRYSLSEGVWFDEALTTYFIGLGWADLFHFIARYEANMALYYIVLKFWSMAAGSEFALRVFSLLCYAGALWFMFLPINKHLGIRAAFTFLILTLCHFYLARYSVEIRGYALALLFMALMWFCWTRIVLDGERHYWLWYALAGLFAVHTHFYIALGIFCLGLLALPALKSRGDFGRWLGAHLVIGVSFLPILAFVVFKESGQLAWLTAPDIKSLIYLGFDYSGAAPEASKPVRFGLLFAVGILVVIGLLRLLYSEGGIKVRGNRLLQLWISALVIAVVPVGIVFLVSQFEPVFSTRFFTPFMPFYLMLAAIGVTLAFRTWALAPVALAMLLLALSAHAYTHREPNRWAEAFGFLANHCGNNQAVLYMTPRGQAAINYYEKHDPTGCDLDPLPFKLVPENYFKGPDEYPDQLEGLNQYRTVWLVMTHLSNPERDKLDRYLEQVESTAGPCEPAYSNVAVEIHRCSQVGIREVTKTP
ncbi:hypothetical protein [Marinobacter shengliensis]|uniref:glycosyltransferase family 39 protein n=1 Tax=Marinobacter shengliensis TaxID=1389223 RepID=UPI001E6433AF|nr:hypothetical protein [Marinobacter shengliensis]MCD1631314.1 hypothetical protein [Marinobacter shengliensis]